jgi:hypothetical protein
MQNEGIRHHLGVREKGSNTPFYSPDKDILNVWPDAMVCGAAFAVDPEGSIRKWLEGQVDGDVVTHVRETLDKLLTALDECKSGDLNQVLAEVNPSWAPFQAIMFGAGIMAFKRFNNVYRTHRLHLLKGAGGIKEPVELMRKQQALGTFDHLVNKAKNRG